MKMHRMLLVLALFGSAAASCTKHASQYDRLCAIYKDYESVPNDDMMRMTELSARVEREIPEIMPAYNVIAQNGVETRYAALVELARREHGVPPNWECATLRKRWPTHPH
jgi:hypothetical protein